MPTKPVSYAYTAHRIFPTMVTNFVSFVCKQKLILKPTLLIHVSRCAKRSCFIGMRTKTAFYAYIIGQLSLLCQQKLFRWYASQNSSLCLRYQSNFPYCVNKNCLTDLRKRHFIKLFLTILKKILLYVGKTWFYKFRLLIKFFPPC